MARSASANFTRTRSEIIQMALRKVGALRQGETPLADMNQEASDVLNVMVKSWQAEGIHLWTVEETTQILTTSSVVIASNGSADYECTRNHVASASTRPISGANYTSYWKALTTTAGSAWVTGTQYKSICNIALIDTVLGTDGYDYQCFKSHTSSASDRPITGANYATYWVMLNTAVAGTWVTATNYNGEDVLDIAEGAFIRDGTTDTPITPLTREEWMGLGSKFTTLGIPSRFWFNSSLTPEIFFFPYPDDDDYILHYPKIRRLEDFDAAGDTADFTVKWLNALIYGLATELSDEYGLPLAERDRIAIKAEAYRARAKTDDNEKTGSVFISPQLRG